MPKGFSSEDIVKKTYEYALKKRVEPIIQQMVNKIPPEQLNKMAQRATKKPNIIVRTMKGVPKALLAGTGAVLGLELASAAYKAIEQIRQPMVIKKHYQKMLEFDPELKQYDPVKTHALFRTLYNYNPTFATDPLIASGWVRQGMELGYVTPAMFKDIPSKQHPDIKGFVKSIIVGLGAGGEG